MNAPTEINPDAVDGYVARLIACSADGRAVRAIFAEIKSAQLAAAVRAELERLAEVANPAADVLPGELRNVVW